MLFALLPPTVYSTATSATPRYTTITGTRLPRSTPTVSHLCSRAEPTRRPPCPSLLNPPCNLNQTANLPSPLRVCATGFGLETTCPLADAAPCLTEAEPGHGSRLSQVPAVTTVVQTTTLTVLAPPIAEPAPAQPAGAAKRTAPKLPASPDGLEPRVLGFDRLFSLIDSTLGRRCLSITARHGGTAESAPCRPSHCERFGASSAYDPERGRETNGGEKAKRLNRGGPHVQELTKSQFTLATVVVETLTETYHRLKNQDLLPWQQRFWTDVVWDFLLHELLLDRRFAHQPILRFFLVVIYALAAYVAWRASVDVLLVLLKIHLFVARIAYSRRLLRGWPGGWYHHIVQLRLVRRPGALWWWAAPRPRPQNANLPERGRELVGVFEYGGPETMSGALGRPDREDSLERLRALVDDWRRGHASGVASPGILGDWLDEHWETTVAFHRHRAEEAVARASRSGDARRRARSKGAGEAAETDAVERPEATTARPLRRNPSLDTVIRRPGGRPCGVAAADAARLDVVGSGGRSSSADTVVRPPLETKRKDAAYDDDDDDAAAAARSDTSSYTDDSRQSASSDAGTLHRAAAPDSPWRSAYRRTHSSHGEPMEVLAPLDERSEGPFVLAAGL